MLITVSVNAQSSSCHLHQAIFLETYQNTKKQNKANHVFWAELLLGLDLGQFGRQANTHSLYLVLLTLAAFSVAGYCGLQVSWMNQSSAIMEGWATAFRW